MNPKRLAIAIVIVFIGVFATDFLIHGIILKQDYAAFASLWRAESDMQKMMGWMFTGQLLASIAATVIWAKGFAEKGCPKCGAIYGFFLGLFMQANTFITYAVQPLPGSIMMKWFIYGMVQSVLLGVLVSVAYKPKSCENKADCCSPKS